MVSWLGPRNIAPELQSTIYVDEQPVLLKDASDAGMEAVQDLTHTVINMLATSLVDYGYPTKQGRGVNAHQFDKSGWPKVIRPCILARVPSMEATRPRLRYFGYEPQVFSPIATWNPYLGALAAGIRQEVRLIERRYPSVCQGPWNGGEVAAIIKSYTQPALIKEDCPRTPPVVSSYRLASFVAFIGNEVLRDISAQWGLPGELRPGLELTGLEISEGQDGITVSRCEPGI